MYTLHTCTYRSFLDICKCALCGLYFYSQFDQSAELQTTQTGGADGGRLQFATAMCSFWNETSQLFSTEGCIAQPNPAPEHAAITWIPGPLNSTLSSSDALSRMWRIGNSSMTENCSLEFDAVDPDYEGLDQGLRKYVGQDCALSHINNSMQCWWDWPSQTFKGSGCHRSQRLECMCTHLTDFLAVTRLEV